jgi:hypothetical protein
MLARKAKYLEKAQDKKEEEKTYQGSLQGEPKPSQQGWHSKLTSSTKP